MATVRKGGPLDSKGKPKTKEPIFGGPLGKAVTGFNYSTLKGMQTRANARERALEAAAAKSKSYKGTFAPLKPMDFISKPAAQKAAAPKPAATSAELSALNSRLSAMGSRIAGMQKTGFAKSVAQARNKPNLPSPTFNAPKTVTSTTPTPSAAASKSTAPKAMAPKVAPVKAVATPRTNTVVTKAETLMPRNVTSEPVMVKREVTIESPAKGNLLERLGRRMRERQLARADRRAGSTSSLPVAPPTVAPKADETQKLSTVARGMLDKYMSKKYMGGGKMKKYMGGGKMDEYKMGGKMDKKKAFMEMIAKLKAKKK